MADLSAEWTPMQFFGERQEPNIIEWFRLEQFGKGASSRLFYNEVPHPTWLRHNGHLDNPEEVLYSFTHANQDQQIIFGIDTTTEEGRKQFKAEYDALHALAPEIIKKEDFCYPHEAGKIVPDEPHFQRIWHLYRVHTLKKAIAKAVEEGKISQGDADAAHKFLEIKNSVSINSWVMAKTGHRPDLEQDESYLATDRVLSSIGINMDFSILTAQHYEGQFWANFDSVYQLQEIEMKEELPYFITDSSSRMQAQALLDQEETKQLAA